MSAPVRGRSEQPNKSRESSRHVRLGGEGHDVNARLIAAPLLFVGDVHGEQALTDVLLRTGLDRAVLHDSRRYVSNEQFECLLVAVRELVPDDDALRAACAYQLKQAYGPARHMLWATTPLTVLKLAARTIRVVLPHAQCTVVAETTNSVRLRYVARDGAHSRLQCLSRQAACIALPTVFNLPKAQLREHGCLSRGDAACEYEVVVQARPRWLPVLMAALLGLIVARLLHRLQLPDVSMVFTLPLLCAISARGFELRRAFRGNARVASEAQAAIEAMARDESDARVELYKFHQRQREWAAVLEAQVDERTSALESVLARIDKLREARTHHLLGFSHDLRNPLTILRASVDAMEPYKHGLPEGEEVLGDIRYAITRMESLLSEMADTLSRDTGLSRRAPEVLVTQALAAMVGRRMGALLLGRDVRVHVEVMAQAPSSIEADPLVVDRVLDNLLTNAAKYTERGSVTIVFDGAQDRLAIRVIDTGRGIADEQIAAIFRPRGSPLSSRAEHSLGIGLSVVVRLLAAVGGKLEVTSVAGEGSTFSVLLPKRPSNSLSPRPPLEGDPDELFNKVVSIGNKRESGQ